MDLPQVQALSAQGESETLEFKRTTGERCEAMHDLCAMLNHRGGHVLFGIDPNGTIVGQQVSDRTLEEVAQEIQQIEPPVFPTVERVDVATGSHAISVQATMGQNRPYSYKGQPYKRVGNTSLKMSRDEYNRMLIERFHGEQRWETELADGWTVDALDRREITRTVEEAIRRGRIEDPGTRGLRELLRGLGLHRDGALRVLAKREPMVRHLFTDSIIEKAAPAWLEGPRLARNARAGNRAGSAGRRAGRLIRRSCGRSASGRLWSGSIRVCRRMRWRRRSGS